MLNGSMHKNWLNDNSRKDGKQWCYPGINAALMNVNDLNMDVWDKVSKSSDHFKVWQVVKIIVGDCSVLAD